jgi:5-methyltetrahydrofolate--homocysteine methyltransferase
VRAFQAAHDDYATIMLKVWPTGSPGVRGTSARARAPGFWDTRRRTPGDQELLAEAYRGIRPAPVTPHVGSTTKGPLFALLDAERNTGMRLTESTRCFPPRRFRVLFSHPQSSYFAVGKVGRDQVEDYARRQGAALAESSAGSPRTSVTSRPI